MRIFYKYRYITLMLILIPLLILSATFTQKNENEYLKENAKVKKIYILYKDETTRVKCLNTNFEELSDIKLEKAWKLSPINEEKVYVSIPGDASTVENFISVLNNGKIIKNIPLKYDLPDDIKYNKYNTYAYVSHMYKFTYNEENCISIIDTEKEKEINMIMYDKVVNDMTFSDNNLMFVASTESINPDNYLDVFDLNENKIIKQISLDINLGSIVYSPKTKLIYGVQEVKKDPLLYIIDWNRGEIIEKIKLNYDYPCNLTLDNYKGKERIYISNVNIDDCNNGNVITIFDPLNRKIVDEITKSNGIHDYLIDNNIYVIARMDNQAYIISKQNKLIKKIKIPFPISITEAY